MPERQSEPYRMSAGGITDRTEKEKRQGERREMESDGFTYITTVGWICRREQCRRNDDKLLV